MTTRKQAEAASLPVQQPPMEIYKQCAEAICRHCREHNQTISQDGRFVHRLGTGENEIVQWCIAWQIHALIAAAPSTLPASSRCRKPPIPGPADIPCGLPDGHEGFCRPDYNHASSNSTTEGK